MNFKKYIKKFSNNPWNILFFVGVFVTGLAVLTQLAEHSRGTQVFSYSEFLDRVEKNEVKFVRISGNEAVGLLSDGQRFESTIANVPQNWELLRSHNVEFAVSDESGPVSLWHFVFFFAMAGCAAVAWVFLRQNRGNSGGALFSIGKSKARMFLPSQVKEHFGSVAGAHEAKEELQDIVDFLKNPEKYKRLGASLKRGVLLVGEPGNGKTLLARAVAGEANCPFFSITGSDFIEIFVGVGAARIRDLFAQARKHTPCIIFIDEIDAIGRQRGSGLGGGHDEREQTLNQLLTEMDGFASNDTPIVVIAATNTPQVLDKALLRPGRFDRRVEVPFPDAQDREAILAIHAGRMQLADNVSLTKIAEDTAGFSGADLANLINQAAIIASKNNRFEITQDDLFAAYAKLIRAQETSGEQSSQTSTEAGSTGKMYLPSQVKVRFDDVAGLQEAKEDVQDIVDFLKSPQKYLDMGARLTRGALLAGDPGNGKTLLAKAIAGEANRPFFSASGSEFVEKYVGVGASRIRDLFAQARRHAPSIVFIDEIDAIGMRRGNGENVEHSQTLNQLLTEMDGFDSDKSSVVVIAATNRADMLDSALMRPGRFDRRIDVPYPDLKARENILHVHASKAKIDESVDLRKVARGTPGFRGADLAHLVNEAVIMAVKNGHESASIKDFEEARDRIVLGKERKSVIMDKKELSMTAYHEAGHALLLLMMPEETEPLHKVTIMPRGGALGVTAWLPERDKYSEYKEEILASIVVALGGRVAEDIAFGRISTGAYGDFRKVSELARKMVCHYGMSDELGPLVYANDNTGSYTYSQETARKIDDEVRAIVGECMNKAYTILRENRGKLDALAEALLEKETLYAKEIYELLGIEPRATHELS